MTDGSAFLIPIALVLLLRGDRETMRPREAWSKGMDWKPPPEILRPERARVKRTPITHRDGRVGRGGMTSRWEGIRVLSHTLPSPYIAWRTPDSRHSPSVGSMTKKDDAEGNDEDSRGKVKSEFPKHTLDQAIGVAQALYEKNGGQPMPPTDTAIAMGISPGSSSYRIILASSLKYGLTSGSYKADRIAIQDLGRNIVEPTSGETKRQALVVAALTPPTFRRMFDYFKGKKIPESTYFENTVTREFEVPREHAAKCVSVFTANMESVGLVRTAATGKWLSSDATLPSLPTPVEPEIEEVIAPPILPGAKPTGGPATSSPATIGVESVFIAHGKNRRLLDQVKQIIEFGKFKAVVSEERETTAIPVPDKVIADMHQSQAGIIIVSADDKIKDGEGNETYTINPNLLIEIGAATVLYKKKVILLWDKRIDVPSNLQGLYRCEFEGETLDWDSGLKLQRTLTEFSK